MQRKMCIRTDANANIGMGHLMRCLSIADEIKKIGHECIFVMADLTMKNTVERRGFTVEAIRGRYDDMELEIDHFIELTKDINPELVIIDSYFVTSDYLRNMGEYCRLAYIDDLGAFAYPVDILINYNSYGPALDYEQIYKDAGEPVPITLLGVEYAPIRKMFRNVPPKVHKKKCTDVLISTGGSDPVHLAVEIVKCLSAESKLNMKYHILLGAMNPDRAEILGVALNNPNIIIHENIDDMRSLMCSCDIAVSAAGSTLYELCACGIPTITYILADNQKNGALAFEKMGLAISVGDTRSDMGIVWTIFDSIEKLNNNRELRMQMSSNMQRLVDGNGAARIASRISDFLMMNNIQDEISCE